MITKSKKISDCIFDDTNTKKSLIKKIKCFLHEKYGIWDMWDILPYAWRMTYYDKISPVLFPRHKRLRKSIPKTWRDTSHLMVDVNFEMIKIFYEEEYTGGWVDWEADPDHKNFATWLEEVYHYITVERPEYENQLSNSYPDIGSVDEWCKRFIPVEKEGTKYYQYVPEDDTPYEVKYANVIKYEKLIESKDTEVLTEFIKRREFFWT